MQMVYNIRKLLWDLILSEKEQESDPTVGLNSTKLDS